MTQPDQIRALITRLARLDASEIWDDALNPAQVAALDYLSRANRFSRAPSHVADYLGTTRGTTSQTLKALARKGYVSERRSETDKRSISYELTEAGHATAGRSKALEAAINTMPDIEQTRLGDSLSALLVRQLRENGGRPFGLCKTCAHHRVTDNGLRCALLSLPLLPDEAEQICHEQTAA